VHLAAATDERLRSRNYLLMCNGGHPALHDNPQSFGGDPFVAQSRPEPSARGEALEETRLAISKSEFDLADSLGRSPTPTELARCWLPGAARGVPGSAVAGAVSMHTPSAPGSGTLVA
jgi:hypothetical protein